MTTIDPAEEQRRRKASYRGSGKALTWTVLAGMLIAAAGALAGLGIAGFMEQFRIMTFQSIGETNAWFPESIPPWLPTVGDFGSIFLSIAAVALYLHWNCRYTGRTEGVGGAGPTLLWLVGCAVSLWFSCLLLWGGEPDTVGYYEGPFRAGEEWGADASIMYWAKIWLPLAATLIALLVFLIRNLGSLGRQSKNRRIDQMLSTQTRVKGTVTEGGVPNLEASKTFMKWTFTFRDHQGQQRWARPSVATAVRATRGRATPCG